MENAEVSIVASSAGKAGVIVGGLWNAISTLKRDIKRSLMGMVPACLHKRPKVACCGGCSSMRQVLRV